MSKSLYELTISFLEPAEAVVTVSGSSEAEVEANLRATLDQVQDLKILSIKNLGPVPETTDLNSAEATAPVNPLKIN
jgi:hypothetical protein